MRMFSVNWFVSTLVASFITMIFIYAIKKVSVKYDVPVISNIAKEV